MDAAIVATGLGKRYGAVTALSDLSLSVQAGEVFGFLGPNGAGKTTTIRILLGLIDKTAGSATVLGRAVDASNAATRLRADIGYLPGELALWPRFSGWHTLRFLEELTGRPAVDRASLLERLSLGDDELQRPVRTYSDGMKQKLGLVQALQCRPRLVFLDEPTKGLDPLVQQAFYDLLVEARARGVTVFFSSHVLPEVERVCDRVAMLKAGRLVKLATMEVLRQEQRRQIRVTFAEPINAGPLARFGELVSPEALTISLLVPRGALPALLRELSVLPVTDLLIEPTTLEDSFLEYYR